MNWKLILQLSMFGLVMGVATVFFIPPKTEPVFWMAIFVVCAYVIARRCPAKRFLHGLLLGVVNSIWITAAHISFFNQYTATHPSEMEMLSSMSASDSPRWMMAMSGLLIGLVSGAVIGLFTPIIGKLMKPAKSA
jgi:hypothetical protein